MGSETVCAVVVTYNRRELLIECLEALENQTRPVNAIYIVDNASTDGTNQLLQERGYLDLPPETGKKLWERTLERNDLLIHYLHLPHNQGGSGGFYEGVKRAYQEGYQWLWLMDDDAQPQLDALEKLSGYFHEDLCALASLKVDMEGNVIFIHRGYFDFNDPYNLVRPLDPEILKVNETLEIDHASFVGLLVSRSAVERVGFPRKDLFIYYDDVEYCIRLKEAGKILLVKSSLIYHHEQKVSLTIKEFLGKKHEFTPLDRLWLSYFGNRNYVWLNQVYTRSRWAFYKFLVRTYAYNCIWILLAGNRKYHRIRLLNQSYLDGLRGNFDNQQPQKILGQD